MKRLLSLLGLLLAFALPSHAQPQTDTIKFEVRLEYESATLEYEFTTKVRNGIEIEWVSANGTESGKFTPDAGGKYTQTITGSGTGYIYYAYEQGSTYSAYLSYDDYDDYDIKVITGESIITSLDVRSCPALTELYCGDNQLTDLDVSHNTALTYLYCNDNQLTGLDVSGCTALSYLWCYDNQLRSLDVSGCTALTYLDCSYNQLTALDVSKNTALRYLACWENQLTDLDVSHNTALTYLYCNDNQLTGLDVSGCTALSYLWCYDNQLRSLDVSGCTALTNLSCSYNQLTALDVSKNTALRYLACWENQLTDLDVSHNTALTSLQCGLNQLTDLDVSKNTALTGLSCWYNQLTDLDVSHNTALDWLYCHDNQLTDLDVSQNTALTDLECHDNHIPLSDLYKAYIQNSDWECFSAYGQTDTLTLPVNQVLDLSSERLLGGIQSTFTLTDTLGQVIHSDAYTEKDFTFQFHKAQSYTLSIENTGIINHNIPEEWDSDSLNGTAPTFTYYISVENPEGYYTVSLAANDSAWGSVSQSGNGTYGEGEEVTITATPKEGYRFDKWTSNDTVFSTEAEYTFAVTENLELAAHFEVVSHTVILSSNNAEWGLASLIGSGTYKVGDSVTVIATPKTGYRFDKWTNGNEVFSTEAIYTFIVTEDLELTAHFEKIQEEPEEAEGFRLSLFADNPEQGYVFRSGNNCIYEEGKEVMILALPKEGYRFDKWTNGDAVFSKEALHTLFVTEDMELTAYFEKLPDDVAIGNPQEDDFQVYVLDHNIILSENRGLVQVFNAIGQCVYNGNATIIPVRQSGVYVVRVGANSHKVIVR